MLPAAQARGTEPNRTASVEQRIAQALAKLGLALKHQTWQQATEEGLSPTQGQLLGLLAPVDGGLTASELAERLGVSLPTVSESVKSLESKGLLTRAPDPRHPRASLLTPTARGRRAATKARAWPEFLAASASALSVNEREAFLSGLLKMIGALQRSGEIPTSRMCFSCVHFVPLAHDGPTPHHCQLIDSPIASHEVRVDCPEHEQGPEDQRARAWMTLTSS